MKNSKLKSKQQGMTLIEILVALVLGTFLLAGVLQIFLNSKQTYRMQDGLSRMQENGRFAMEFISRDVRAADYRVCYTDAAVATAVSGADSVAAVAPLTLVTDSITLTQQTNACGAAAATSAITYSIQPDPNSGEAALYKSVGGAAAQALVEGVENMQILYGADTNADSVADYYVPAGTAGLTISQIISVRISLLVRSVDNLIPQPKIYTFNGVNTTPVDRRLRRVFSSTISIRNRLR